MAIYRKIHTSFWSDPFIQDLDNDYKLFYMYLLTNEKTKQCGIYEISKKQISFELGFSMNRVTDMLNYFVKIGKIMFSDETKEIALKNWAKYNGSTSPLVAKCIQSELCHVKNRVLIEYVNGIHTQSQQEEEQEQKEEEEQTPEQDVFLPVKEPSIDEIFEIFWTAYTKKGNRKESFTAFNKISKNEMLEIKAHLPKYLENHHRNNKMEFLPNFSTYLNQKRWNDKLPYLDKNQKINNWGV